MHSTDDFVMIWGDANRHVGGHIDCFDRMHEGYDIGQRNLEGRMMLYLS